LRPINELVRLYLTGESLEGDELLAVIEELDRIIAEREKRDRDFAIGRALAAQRSQVWGSVVRDLWFWEAVAVLQENPQWLESPKRQAAEVAERCTSKGLLKRNKEPYDASTIYNAILPFQPLLKSLSSSISQANSVECAPADAMQAAYKGSDGTAKNAA